MFEFNRNTKFALSMNVLCRKKNVYPQIDKHFRCIEIYSSKAIARLPSLCGYTPLVISGTWLFTGGITLQQGKVFDSCVLDFTSGKCWWFLLKIHLALFSTWVS